LAWRLAAARLEKLAALMKQTWRVAGVMALS
jgi:hypothetical protein